MLTFFGLLAQVSVWPRTTMRRILDSPSRNRLLPLVVLAAASAFTGDANKNVRIAPAGWLITACILILTVCVTVLVFYLLSWAGYAAGKFLLEGKGTRADVTAAVAWGLAPSIWALLYRIPAAAIGLTGSGTHVSVGKDVLRIDPSQISGGCVLAFLFGVLQLATLVWYVTVTSRTIAEAHRFSAWRGFGTLVIVGIAPLVIVIAGLLAAR